MSEFATKHLPQNATALAPDGSEVRVLLGLAGGGMAHFSLAPDAVSKAVVHRTVEEIWYVLTGRAQMWRAQGEREEVVDLIPGTCLTIPLGTRFQFRTTSDSAFTAIGVTMPPWPGEHEALLTEGPWRPTSVEI